MRITYTGRQVELAPAQIKKLEVQCGKLGKMLDGRKSECEARVILSTERHLHKAEVTVLYHDHQLVGAALDSDLFTAIHGAIDRLEKQAIKVRARWRDKKRAPRKENAPAEPVAATEPPPVKSKAAAKLHGKNGSKAPGSKAKIRHIDGQEPRQTLTLEEAIEEMGTDREYLTFYDSKTGAVNVLVRRRDGHFDLVEA